MQLVCLLVCSGVVVVVAFTLIRRCDSVKELVIFATLYCDCTPELICCSLHSVTLQSVAALTAVID